MIVYDVNFNESILWLNTTQLPRRELEAAPTSCSTSQRTQEGSARPRLVTWSHRNRFFCFDLDMFARASHSTGVYLYQSEQHSRTCQWHSKYKAIPMINSWIVFIFGFPDLFLIWAPCCGGGSAVSTPAGKERAACSTIDGSRTRMAHEQGHPCPP